MGVVLGRGRHKMVGAMLDEGGGFVRVKGVMYGGGGGLVEVVLEMLGGGGGLMLCRGMDLCCLPTRAIHPIIYLK